MNFVKLNHKAWEIKETGAKRIGTDIIDNLITRDPLFVRFRTRVVQRYSRTIFIVRWLTTATYPRSRFASFFFFSLLIEGKKKKKVENRFVQFVMKAEAGDKIVISRPSIDFDQCNVETILLETNNIEMQIIE